MQERNGQDLNLSLCCGERQYEGDTTVERVNAQLEKEQQLQLADYFELKSTQWLCGLPFVHDDSTVVMNVKDEARAGQKMVMSRH